MSQITLRQLRYLESLAKHRHFSRAADDCAVTQPALSMQIKELEQSLGLQLVERRAGEIALTSKGEEIADRASQILIAARDLVDVAKHGSSVLTGTLRLGVIPTLSPYLLPRVLPVLQKKYPELRLELRETQTKPMLDELVRGNLDAVMLALPVEQGELESAPLFEDRFLLAVPSGDPLQRRAQISADEFDPRRLLLLEEGHCLRDQALAFCSLPRAVGSTALGATSLATVMQMVASGYGITLVPEIATDTEVRDSRIKLIHFVKPQPSRTIGLAWRKTSPRRADFEALAEVVKAAISAANKTGRHRAAPFNLK
jgi:LysR family transcriptional regulator, hydrogen peroxide-inducible genes activator